MFQDLTENDDGGDNLHTIFVYGSLKRGYRNNAVFLQDAKYLGTGQTLASHYDMLSVGLFPTATKNGNYALFGELYKINDVTLQALDMLESNGSLYRREIVQVVGLHDARFSASKEPVKAWLYFWMHPTSSSLGNKNVFSYLSRNVMVKTWGLDEHRRATAPLSLQAEEVLDTPRPTYLLPSKTAEAKAGSLVDDGYGDDEDDDDEDEFDFYKEEPVELDIRVMRMKMRN